jgi:hypothetical protein
MTILFLDFDGVMHPNEVFMSRKVAGGVVLRCDGHNLFEHAELLADLLEPHQDVRIVLSTSWVHALSFSRAKERLPERLRSRVKSATWHSQRNKYEWHSMTRYQQILQYVNRHNITDWLSIDNDDLGWPDAKRHHLILTNDFGGLGGTVGAVDDLVTKLELRGE